MNSKENCANCKYCRKLYVPPADCFNDIPKDRYVCTLFVYWEDENPQYLGNEKDIKLGRCEEWSNKNV